MSFWKNKKVLVTGANGFVGSNLVKVLISKGASIVAYKGISTEAALAAQTGRPLPHARPPDTQS